ncbi:DUF881 domain-containing protein [Hoyosella sp. G463]|uniref:DUF881 domain-containing protein n=1 Tax=Lolliginicoccus lacisalsi TaxID=2742202 RepID=A0A927JE09_9ACTN|nr:DUF881 domain-containing protein [Lolliginicoccus lacisalsi]MBD8507608.1 DUF881 domain-containing protein [Lolliginicoccus lacisalsi]
MPHPAPRSPQPSLLRALLTSHLDPGYAAARARAQRSGGRLRHPLADVAWLVVGAFLIGIALGGARGWAEQRAPDTELLLATLRAEARQASARVDALAIERDQLAAEIGDSRSRLAELGGPAGRAVDELALIEHAVSATPVEGAGIEVDLAEPAEANAITGTGRVGATRNTLLDRDLQIVVNALWAAGAEAIAVDGVRIGAHTAIRQAGRAILVDNHVISEPYVISAIGEPRRLQSSFIASGAYVRMSGLGQLYGIGFAVRDAEHLELPGASVREMRLAEQKEAP